MPTSGLTSDFSVHIPSEILLRILHESSQSSTTHHARNVCLVCRASYQRCWPSVWRIVCLRNPQQLKQFSEMVYEPPGVRRLLAQNSEIALPPGITAPQWYTCTDEERMLKRKQDAITCLYLNNNKDAEGLRALQTDEKPEMWMISILLAARNLEILHVEEYWSMSFPWENQEDKPLVAYPLMLLSRLPTAIQAAYATAPQCQWSQRMFGRSITSEQKNSSHNPVDIYEAINVLQRTESLRRAPMLLNAQPSEITLSALAMSPSHLFSAAPMSIEGQHVPFPQSDESFERLTHLHLYFAKLDRRLLEALRSLPSLTHLRITRPFSELLPSGVQALLGWSEDGQNSRLKKLIIEAGIYMDVDTVNEIREIEAMPANGGRLEFSSSHMFQSGTVRPSQYGRSASSTSHIVNYVTNSEDCGFHDFVRRAHGLDGVWQTNDYS